MENTLPSFALALEAGAEGIELDVHATRDGIVVVHHDPALKDGTVIADRTFAALRAATAGSVPALTDVCELVAGGAELFVELKGDAIEGLVLDVLHGFRGRFAVHSFDHAMISRIHSLDASIRLGVLFEEAPASVRELMDQTGARDVWPRVPLIERQLVDEVHAAGGRVIAWTVNSLPEAKALAELGVDGLCGDDVRIFPGA